MGPELMVARGQLGLEGLVAKRLDSIYRPGERSEHWVKASARTGARSMRHGG